MALLLLVLLFNFVTGKKTAPRRLLNANGFSNTTTTSTAINTFWGTGAIIGFAAGGVIFIVAVIISICVLYVTKKKVKRSRVGREPIREAPVHAKLQYVQFRTLLANMKRHPCHAAMSKLPNRLSTLQNKGRQGQIMMERCFALSRPFAVAEFEELLGTHLAHQARLDEPSPRLDIPALLDRLLSSRWASHTAATPPSPADENAALTPRRSGDNPRGVMSHRDVTNGTPLTVDEQFFCGLLGAAAVTPLWLSTTNLNHSIQVAALAIPTLELTDREYLDFRHFIITRQQNTLDNGYGIHADITLAETQRLRLYARFYRNLARHHLHRESAPLKRHQVWAPRLDANGNVFYYDIMSRNATWDSPKMQDLRIRQLAMAIKIREESFRNQDHVRPKKGDWVVIIDPKFMTEKEETRAEIGEVEEDESERGDGAPFFVRFNNGTRKWLREDQVVNCPGSEFKKMIKAEEMLRGEVARENHTVAQLNYGRFLYWDKKALESSRKNSCYGLVQSSQSMLASFNNVIQGPRESVIETKRPESPDDDLLPGSVTQLWRSKSTAAAEDAAAAVANSRERQPKKKRSGSLSPLLSPATEYSTCSEASSVGLSSFTLAPSQTMSPSPPHQPLDSGVFNTSPAHQALSSPAFSPQTAPSPDNLGASSGDPSAGSVDPDRVGVASPTVEMIVAAVRRFGACSSDTNAIIPSYEEASRMFNAGSEKYLPVSVGEGDVAFFNLEVLWCRVYAMLFPALQEASRLADAMGTDDSPRGYLDLGDLVDTANAYGVCAVALNTMLVLVTVDIIRDHELPGLSDVDFRCPNEDIHSVLATAIDTICRSNRLDDMPGTLDRSISRKQGHIDIRATTTDTAGLMSQHGASGDKSRVTVDAARRVDNNLGKVIIVAYSWRTGALPGNCMLDEEEHPEDDPGTTGQSGEYLASASAVLQLQDPFVNKNISGRYVGFW